MVCRRVIRIDRTIESGLGCKLEFVVDGIGLVVELSSYLINLLRLSVQLGLGLGLG